MVDAYPESSSKGVGQGQLLPRSTSERRYRDSAVEGAVRDSVVITSLRIDTVMIPILRAGHLDSWVSSLVTEPVSGRAKVGGQTSGLQSTCSA